MKQHRQRYERPLPAMKLLEDVTFDSLTAVRQELREWFGSDNRSSLHGRPQKASRDVLLSIIIHSLAAELSDVRVRSQIQASLSDLNNLGHSSPGSPGRIPSS